MLRSAFRLTVLGLLVPAIGCGKPATIGTIPVGTAITPVAVSNEDLAAVESVVKAMVDASKAGDQDKYFAQLAQPYRDTREAQQRAEKSFNALLAAVEKKYGNDPQSDLPSAMWHMPGPTSGMPFFNKAEIISKQPQPDGSVVVRIKTIPNVVGIAAPEVEERYTARKEGAAWKLAPWQVSGGFMIVGAPIGRTVGGDPAKPPPPPPTFPKQEVKFEPPNLGGELGSRVFLDKKNELFERLAKEIAAGKYAKRAAAEDAIYNGIDAISKEMAGPGGGFFSSRAQRVGPGIAPPEKK